MLRASVISYALQKRKRKRKNIVCFSSFHYHRFLHLIIIVFFIHFDSAFREQVRSCLIETRSRDYHQLCLLFLPPIKKRKEKGGREGDRRVALSGWHAGRRGAEVTGRVGEEVDGLEGRSGEGWKK